MRGEVSWGEIDALPLSGPQKRVAHKSELIRQELRVSEVAWRVSPTEVLVWDGRELVIERAE